MTPAPIRVECYAGGRSDERPRRVIIENRVYVIARLLAESVEVSLITEAQTRRYKVLTDERLVLEVVRSSDGTWHLVS